MTITNAFVCLSFSLSTIAFKYNCEEIKDSSMIYTVGGEIFVRHSGIGNKLTKFSQDVTGLSMYKDYLYASVKRSGTNQRDSGIWRVKLSTNFSTIFDDVKDIVWQEFDVVNAADADILSMTIAKGYIYSGRSDAVIWKCSADTPHSCQDYHILQTSMRHLGMISDIVYNPNDDKIYALESLRSSYDGSWFHSLWRCSPNTPQSYGRVDIELQGWPTFHVGFGSFWITDSGQVKQCRNKVCTLFHDFGKTGYMSIGASSKYLYVRLEESNRFWRCDPSVVDSCSKAFEISHEGNVGPFIFV